MRKTTAKKLTLSPLTKLRSVVTPLNLGGYFIAFVAVCWYNYQKLQAASLFLFYFCARMFGSLPPWPHPHTMAMHEDERPDRDCSSWLQMKSAAPKSSTEEETPLKLEKQSSA